MYTVCFLAFYQIFSVIFSSLFAWIWAEQWPICDHLFIDFFSDAAYLGYEFRNNLSLSLSFFMWLRFLATLFLCDDANIFNWFLFAAIFAINVDLYSIDWIELRSDLAQLMNQIWIVRECIIYIYISIKVPFDCWVWWWKTCDL